MSSRPNFALAGEDPQHFGLFFGAVVRETCRGKAPDRKGAMDRPPAADAQLLSDLLEAKAPHAKANSLGQIPSQAHFVMPDMVSLGQDFEVGQVIVEPVAVAVVNELGRFQRAAQMFFHDDAVLELILGDPVFCDADSSVGRVGRFLNPTLSGSTAPSVSCSDVAKALHLSILPIADAGSQ